MTFGGTQRHRGPLSCLRRWMQFTALVAVSGLIAACASAPRAADAEDAHAPGIVDSSCSVDNDCQVKDVGNCCGYFPACVNRNSETFPELVRAQCAKEGRMGICGFPTISACRCVDKLCVPEQATADPG